MIAKLQQCAIFGTKTEQCINKEKGGRGDLRTDTHTHIHTRKQIMVMVNSELAGLIAMTTTADSHTKNTAESSSSLHSSRHTGQGGTLGEVTD